MEKVSDLSGMGPRSSSDNIDIWWASHTYDGNRNGAGLCTLAIK